MIFSEMLEILQERNDGRMVFCNNGSFYIAIGRDAILLNKILDLKLTCMKEKMCKVGFPITAYDKYLGKLIKTGYGFTIFDFDSEKEELNIVVSCTGKRLNNEIKRNNCFNCEKNKNKKLDKYTKALAKFYRKEDEFLEENKKINNGKKYE